MFIINDISFKEDIVHEKNVDDGRYGNDAGF